MDPDPTRVHTPDSSPFETAAPVESKDRVHGLESDSSPDFGLVFESGTLKDPAAAAVYTLSCSIYQKFGFRDLRKTKIQKLGKSRLIINLICRSSNLESNFTGVTTSAKFEAAEGLGR